MSPSQRLAVVTELFAPSVGGQETRLARFARGLVGRGYHVEVFTTDHMGGTLPATEWVDGVEVHRYVALADYVRPGSRSPWALVRYARATAALVKRLRASGWAVLLNEMPVGHLPFVREWASATVDWCEVPSRPWARWVANGAANRFSRGTAVDESVAGALRAHAPRARLVTVRTPVDLERYVAGRKERGLVLFLGRLVPHKGIESLAEAVERLRSKDQSDIHLWIAGEGPLRAALEARYGESDAVRLLGPVTEEQKLELLGRASLLGIPSRREGLPNAIVESVATLTPILTAEGPENGGAKFVRRHGVGIVAADSRPETLAAALRSCTEARLEACALAEARLRPELAPGPNLDRLESVLAEGWAA